MGARSGFSSSITNRGSRFGSEKRWTGLRVAFCILIQLFRRLNACFLSKALSGSLDLRIDLAE
jgi:hypothetical protein